MFKSKDRKVDTSDDILDQVVYLYYTKLLVYTQSRLGDDPVDDMVSVKEFVVNLEDYMKANNRPSLQEIADDILEYVSNIFLDTEEKMKGKNVTTFDEVFESLKIIKPTSVYKSTKKKPTPANMKSNKDRFHNRKPKRKVKKVKRSRRSAKISFSRGTLEIMEQMAEHKLSTISIRA